MDKNIPALIAEKVQIKEVQVINTLQLLDNGATIPFISRYRKERTEGLNEVIIALIADEYKKLLELTKRKETIVGTIEKLGQMTDALRDKINETWMSSELEDLYMPYKPKRRTRAQIAREKGLEPLAKLIMTQQSGKPETLANPYLSDKVETIDDALAGARDIIAEWINEKASARKIVRSIFDAEAVITSCIIKGKEKDATKYSDYFKYSKLLYRTPSHALLAMRRGEAEEILRVDISPIEKHVISRLNQYFVRQGPSAEQMKMAVADCYKRLLKPSIETEYAALSKETADKEAIRVFEANLRQLLLSPPLGQKRVLGIDPGFRTGCKVVCLSEHGKLLHNETIYPHAPQSDHIGAMKKLTNLVEQFDIQAIAIGDGTAGRETEILVQNIRFDRKVRIFSVNENGASIYSASAIAREEFPDYDVTVRGAVSLGRRLMDPLAELVKIDPKSIGVGQYQYDVDQKALKEALTRTIEFCVNKVGVNLNTTSKYLLTFVSGIGPAAAEAIVKYRDSIGGFRSRTQLKEVRQVGVKTFEQCAGFLRITDADNPLDNSAVHPESYGIVEKMAQDLSCTVADLLADKTLREQIVPEQYVTEQVGLPTLHDIMNELDKPGRDPRETIRTFEFDRTIKTIDDLQVGMILPGVINNITKFGAFVNIGIKENGLVHVSQMINGFVNDPTKIVSLHQQISVKVIDIDVERKRILLSMKDV